MKCAACDDVKEPPVVEGKKLQYPVGWSQVQVSDGMIINKILCDKDTRTFKRFLKV